MSYTGRMLVLSEYKKENTLYKRDEVERQIQANQIEMMRLRDENYQLELEHKKLTKRLDEK